MSRYKKNKKKVLDLNWCGNALFKSAPEDLCYIMIDQFLIYFYIKFSFLG